MDVFGNFLRSTPELGPPLPQSIMEAIPSGIWAVIQKEITEGRLQTLPELAPEVARIIVASFHPA